MKKILIYTLFAFALLSGCKKDENELIDGEKPEERVTGSLTKYQDQLTASPYGWKAYLATGNGNGFSFYLNFNKTNRVTMLGDLDVEPASVPFESSYRLKASQAPSLLFDTYSYMHLLADPNPNTFGGASGWGFYSDFEFNFGKQSGDTIMLEGKFLGSQLMLIKATQQEQTAYNSKGLLTSILNSVGFFDSSDNLYVTFGDGVKVQTSFNYTNKQMALTWDDKGTFTSATPFAFTLTGIELFGGVTYKDKTISSFTWDAAKKLLYTTVAGTRIEVLTSPTPILPLHSLIGLNYSSVIVPNATTYPGWSADFIARKNAAAATMLAGPYRLRFDRMVFAFNTSQQAMTVTVDIYQNATGFLAPFPYTYTKTTAGVYKFTAGTPTGNAALIVADMAPLTTQRLNADHFTLDYFVNPANGQLLGQFKSVEHPDFTFTGTLQ